MTDLLHVLPDFPVGRYASLIPALERHQVTTSELLTLDVTDIGRRTQLPLLDLKRLCAAVLDALHADFGVAEQQKGQPGSDGKRAGVAGENASIIDDGHQPSRHPADAGQPSPADGSALRNSATSLATRWATISTLDPDLDAALGGGIPTGYVTEVTGESGAGKTQLLLSLLLAVQLPPPLGLGRPAMYISTEAALSTRRLRQILSANPLLLRMRQQQQPFVAADGEEVEEEEKAADFPSLDRVLSTTTPDLESQDHILHFQVPVEVQRRNIGLVVLDSVAANYRAEFERGAGGGGGAPGSNMGARSAELVRLGMLLRGLARRYNLAVVVANQVADRFAGSAASTSSPLVSLGNPSSGSGPTAYPLHPLPPPSSTAGGSTGTGGQHNYLSQESPLASRSRTPAPAPPQLEPSSSMADLIPRSSMSTTPATQPPPPPPPFLLHLDHQQRWFTGWGDDPDPGPALAQLKTPSLGVVWSTQIAARIALFKTPAYHGGRPRHGPGSDDGPHHGMPAVSRSWRRWMKVVFAPHVAGTGPGVDGAVEFEVTAGGLRAMRTGEKGGGNGS